MREQKKRQKERWTHSLQLVQEKKTFTPLFERVHIFAQCQNRPQL
jgi:hypothetical protein